MIYSTPKVTIDLNEYNFLLKKIEEMKKDHKEATLHAYRVFLTAIVQQAISKLPDFDLGKAEMLIKQSDNLIEKVMIMNDLSDGMIAIELKLKEEIK